MHLIDDNGEQFFGTTAEFTNAGKARRAYQQSQDLRAACGRLRANLRPARGSGTAAHGCSGHSWNYPGHCRISHRCFNVQEALMKTALLASVAALSVLSTSVAYAADESDPPLPRFREMCVQEVIAGNRGFCSPNPYYRGPEFVPLRAKRKRYYR